MNNNLAQPRVPCTKINVFPQLDGEPSCWFNAIVMTILFSQYSRNMIYANQCNWSTMSHILRNSFKTIVHDTSGNLNIRSLACMTPEELLRELHTMNPNIFYVHTVKPHYSVAYLTRLYDHLGAKKSLYFSASEDSSTNTIKADLLVSHKTTKVTQSSNGNFHFNFDGVEIFWESQPEDWSDSDNGEGTYDYLVFDFSNEWYARKHVVLEFEIPMQKFKSQYLEWSGKEYVLDSMIWTSTDDSHIIAGITCDGERYIYSGYQPEKQDSVPLYKYDWFNDEREIYCLKNPVREGFSSRRHHAKENDVYCFDPDHGTKKYIFVNKKYLERKIVNPTTGRLVKTDGKIGKKLSKTKGL